MSLRSRITGSDQTDDETDTDQTTTDPAVTDEAGTDGTAVRPTFTPAPVETDGLTEQTAFPRQAYPADDVMAQPPTLVEPAGQSDYDRPDDERSDYAGTDNSMADYNEQPSSSEPDYNAPAGQPVSVEPEQTARAYEAAPASDAAETYEPAEASEAYEATAVDSTVTPADTAPVTDTTPVTATGKQAAPVGGSSLDGPLFTENPELRGQWQHIQAEFVDDPQHAVADAADLVQQAGQALVSTLQQRQERMRSEWDRDKANRTGTATDNEVTTTGGVDTEQLRQIMQRYRALFDQLSQPV
jgi:hypothetical protein